MTAIIRFILSWDTASPYLTYSWVQVTVSMPPTTTSTQSIWESLQARRLKSQKNSVFPSPLHLSWIPRQKRYTWYLAYPY